MAPRPTWPDADEALEGALADTLRGLRAEHVGFSEIAYRLRVLSSGRVKVSGETVRRWCIDRGIHVPTPEAVA